MELQSEPQPTLRHAKNRLSWASERLLQLKRQEAAARTAAGELAVTYDAATFDPANPPPPTLDWSRVKSPVNSAYASMLVSETLHHLRCALDHVAYNLAWLDSGVRQDHTAFPITGSDEKWEQALARGRLRGVSPEHVDEIRRYQPFEGCLWTATLQKLSNFDKHRLVVEASRSQTFELTFQPDKLRPDPTQPGRLVHPPGKLSASGVELPNGEAPTKTLIPISFELSLLIFSLQHSFDETDSVTLEPCDRSASWAGEPPAVPS